MVVGRWLLIKGIDPMSPIEVINTGHTVTIDLQGIDGRAGQDQRPLSFKGPQKEFLMQHWPKACSGPKNGKVELLQSDFCPLGFVLLCMN